MKKAWVISSLLILVCAIVYLPSLMISPGKLSEQHKDLDRKCMACHKPFFGASAAKCIQCHQPGNIGIDSGGRVTNRKALFHKNLKTQNCVSCHGEHRGRDATLSYTTFNHSMLPAQNLANCVGCHEAPKNPTHQNLISSTCSNCHNTTDWTASGFNHKRLTGAVLNNCATCHKAPKDIFHTQNLSASCGGCHHFEGWKPSTFDHSSYFLLDNNHNASCNTCHTGNNYKVYTCYGCHEHSEQNIIAEHTEHGNRNISNCISCHKSGSEHEGGEHEGGEGENDD